MTDGRARLRSTAIAAFVLSALALIVAGVSAAYARVQGVETRELRRIEDGRRHEERAPKLTGEVEAVNNGDWHRLWLTLETPTSLERLEVHIVEGEGLSFTPGTNGVAPMSLGPASSLPVDAVYDEPEALSQGQRYCWSLRFDPKTSPDRMRIRVI
jgi:hypothetical protein